MTTEQEKIVQYLSEAQATERALTRVLQAQIAMTPHGTYRNALDNHLSQTRSHADRVGGRLNELRGRQSPAAVAVGLAETLIGQALALGKMPFDLARGSSGEEKVLKNAKDAAATEALEIATYAAIERLARSVGDRTTATLAASIREDEEQMLERILREIPKLTDRVVSSEIDGEPSYDLTETGAADAVREGADTAKKGARKTAAAGKRTAREARKVPGVAQAEGQLKGIVASEEDLAIAHYDSLTADEITSRLPSLSQVDLAKIDSYERRGQNRSTILGRVTTLRGDEPWPGYDELTAAEVQAALSERSDDELDREVRAYEQAHKNRAGVLNATEREHSRV